jgi:hypothetical protein
MEFQWYDPILLSWQFETHDQVAGSGGTFNFDYPAYNLVLPNDTDVYFRLTYYYNDPNLWLDLANLDWLWGTSTWNEWLY